MRFDWFMCGNSIMTTNMIDLLNGGFNRVMVDLVDRDIQKNCASA